MLLALTAFLPLAAALVVMLFRSRPGRACGIALIGSLATLAAALLLAIEVTSVDPAHLAWQPFGAEGGAPLALFADGLSLAFVLLTAVLGVVAVLVSLPGDDDAPAFFALLLALESAVMTVFLAGDLVLFYVAWEAVLIPMFFLIGRFGHENRRHAAMKFFIYTFAASAPMLVGIISAIAGDWHERARSRRGGGASSLADARVLAARDRHAGEAPRLAAPYLAPGRSR